MRTSLLALIAAGCLGGSVNIGLPPASYVVSQLKPDSSWDGTLNNMALMTPSADTSYQGTPGFNEEVIAAFDEYQCCFIEDTNHRIVVGAVNADPLRGGIAKVVFRLGQQSVTVTQQIYTARKTCGFPVDISSNLKDGDAVLTADVYPVRGYPTRLTLSLTLATLGQIKRPIVYVNPDPTPYTLVRADDGQTITVGTGSDSVTASQAANPATPFLTIHAAIAAFAYNGTGACDILVPPNTTYFCDMPTNTFEAVQAYANNNTRLIRVRSVTGQGLVRIGRNDRAGFYSTPAAPYTYAPPSPAYGGLPGGTGVPLIEPDGSQALPYMCPLATHGGNYIIMAAMIEFQGVFLDLSSFRALTNAKITINGGFVNADGTCTTPTGVLAFTKGSQIVDPNGPFGPATAYSDTERGTTYPISTGHYKAFCEVTYTCQSQTGITFMRNVQNNLSWDAAQNSGGSPPPVWWNNIVNQQGLWYSRYCLPEYLTVSQAIYREDSFVQSPNTMTVSNGTTAAFTDPSENPVAHGLYANEVFLIGTAPHTYVRVSVNAVVDNYTVTIKTSYANKAYNYGTGQLTDTSSVIKLNVASDGVTCTFVSATDNTTPTPHGLKAGNAIIIYSVANSKNTWFVTTVASVVSSTSLILTNSVSTSLSQVGFQTGFTIVSAVPPSSQSGGQNHIYYGLNGNPNPTCWGPTSKEFMSGFQAIAGSVMRPISGALSGQSLNMTSGTPGDLPLSQGTVLPTSLLPTMQTTGTALTLSAAPSYVYTGNSSWGNIAYLFEGAQIINDATDECRFVVSVISPTQAILNAPFSINATSGNLPAGTAYRTGGFSVLMGNFASSIAVGDKFWTTAVAHPDYMQFSNINNPFQPVSKNWWFYNYSTYCYQYQLMETQSQTTNFSNVGTLSTDGNGNGVIANPTLSPYTLTTTTSGPVTTCTSSGANGLYVGQHIGILNSDGSVFNVGVVAATQSSTKFTLVSALPSDVTSAAFKIGHTVVPGDMVVVGNWVNYVTVCTGRRVTATIWGADFTQYITFNEDFPAALYPSGVPAGTSYRQSKNPRNLAMVNCNYLQLDNGTGGGIGGAIMHYAFVQCTAVAPYGGSGYSLRQDYNYGAMQNSGWFDCLVQYIDQDALFAAADPKGVIRDNVSFLQLHTYADTVNDIVVSATFGSSYHPTSTNHRKLVGQLAGGVSTGSAIVPYDESGKLLIPGQSYVGGAQPVGA